jgi:hypothetical protein
MKRSLPLAASLRAAAAFVPRVLVQAPGVLVLFFVVLALPAYGAGLGLGDQTMLVAAILALLVGLSAQGALYRLGVSPNLESARALGFGPLGLQFGAAELRLLAAEVLVGLFLGVVLIALGVILAFAAGALGVAFDEAEGLAAHDPWRVQALAGLGLVALWVFLQLSIRLSLYKAATVARRRVVSVGALGLSEHNFWRLLCGMVVTLLPTIALAVWRSGTPAQGAWAGIASAAVVAFVQTPLSIGFLSEAYKRLEYWRDHPGEG